MQPSWNILQAMLHCQYKAWQLSRSEDEQTDIHQHLPIITEATIKVPVNSLTLTDKLVLTALSQCQSQYSNQSLLSVRITNALDQTSIIKIRADSKKAQKLFADAENTINKNEPPAFYRNSHCPECQFKETCYKKLKERDCISLLSGMSPKVILKFHKKGIYSVAQLSHLFRPRRRRRHPQVSTNYLWELKALAITEQKTFVLYPPDIKETAVSIYLDFEGLPDEEWIYLIGVLIKEQGEQEKRYSYWADTKDKEKEIFTSLFVLLRQYPEASIYHYGSYETKGLRQVQKKWPYFKNDITGIEPQMVNLLGFLRTHVYPPVYSNGLKEVAHFLGFKWKIAGADGLQSVQWRKSWENGKDATVKENLIQYNLDDCKALLIVKQWFAHLATDGQVAEVSQRFMRINIG